MNGVECVTYAIAGPIGNLLAISKFFAAAEVDEVGVVAEPTVSIVQDWW